MIKKITCVLWVLGALFLTSCGDSNGKTSDKTTESKASTTGDSQIPTMKINEADWVETDLSSISNLTPVTVKLPKDAKMEKNGNGGVDVHLNNWYTITVYNDASSNVKSAIAGTKSITVNDQSYQDGKLLIDEPNGFVYTYTLKTEKNGNTYQPESHFVFYLEKGGAIYSFQSMRPLDNFDVAGSAYTEDIAKQVYNIIKNSAKEK